MNPKRVGGQPSPFCSQEKNKKIVFTTEPQRTQRQKFFICREIPADEKLPAVFGGRRVFRSRKGARHLCAGAAAEAIGLSFSQI